MKTIFHLDLDAFFVSVERILDPSLHNKPVIVGGDPNGRGVVAACSYEAREYGIHSAMPVRTAYRLCPSAVYLHGHHSEYVKYSKAVKALLERYAPLMEQASVDEFYMDFTGCKIIYGEFPQFALTLQNKILNELSLPCSVGIASNKTTAKIASDFRKPMGITYVPPGLEKEFLSSLPVEAIPGVGRVTYKSLREKGFKKVADILTVSEDYFAAAFGKFGIDIWHKANGEGNDIITTSHGRKSISKETTFSHDIVKKSILESILFGLTGKVCQSLRNKNWLASTIGVKLRYSDFTTLTREKTIPPTDDDKIVFDTALELFRKAYTRRVGLRLIGIRLTKFTIFFEQEELFLNEEMIRQKMLNAVTRLRDKYGYSVINIGKSENNI